MARRVVIDLMTEDNTRKAKARTIATSAATDVISTRYVGERGTMLEVIAERIEADTVVGKIRKEAKLRDAKLISVGDQN
ncbi:hypothetical protein ACJRO7_022167 [Eucalyptus globulus]|uniref:Uncharacterized protein n=1 Tax=Eucalyptus globulus TaxID=34317 RepID=A0ABD3KMC2_EUCGL